MKLWYVNPYTRELCVLEATGADYERARDSLRGQGVTQTGAWMQNDFLNWGVANIATWDFESYSKPTRWLKCYIDRNRELRTDCYHRKPE